MASPMVEFCEQSNPGVLAEFRKVGAAFSSARRIQASILATAEKKTLLWLAERTPAWINSDHLTGLGFLGQIAAGIFLCPVARQSVLPVGRDRVPRGELAGG